MNRLSILSLILLFAAPVTAFGGISYEQAMPDEELLRNAEYDIIVAAVTQVEDAQATNGHPPIVTLDVQEVVRGEVPIGPLVVQWAPRGHDVDWSGADAQRLIAQWAAQPLSGPPVDSKLILLLHTFKDINGQQVRFVSVRCRFPYSDEKVREIRDILSWSKEDMTRHLAEVAHWDGSAVVRSPEQRDQILRDASLESK